MNKGFIEPSPLGHRIVVNLQRVAEQRTLTGSLNEPPTREAMR